MGKPTEHDAPLTREQVNAELALLADAVDAFAAAMKAELAGMAQDENRTGWNDPANAHDYYIKLLAHASGVRLAAGQEVDIANFAMFLWYQRTVATLRGGRS